MGHLMKVAGFSFVSLALFSCSGSQPAQRFSQAQTSRPPGEVAPIPAVTPGPSNAPSPLPVPSTVPSPGPSPAPSPVPDPSPRPEPPRVPTVCDPNGLREWQDWSSFSLREGRFQGMDVRQGISSRRLILSGVDQGYDRPQDGGRVDVYAEDLELKDVAIQTGSVRYTRSVRFHGNVTTFGAITKEKLFDFQTAEDHLNDLQFKLLDYPVNGSTNRVCETDGKNCTLTLAGNNRILNRFQVEERDLINLKFLKVRVPEKSTAVVLLQSKDVHFRNVRVEAPQESIWTLGLPGGKFKVEFMELPGTVVLLSSAFELDRALLTGRVLSKTFNSPDCFEDGSCSTIDSSSLPGRICL